jgi:hypothetical protein
MQVSLNFSLLLALLPVILGAGVSAQLGGPSGTNWYFACNEDMLPEMLRMQLTIANSPIQPTVSEAQAAMAAALEEAIVCANCATNPAYCAPMAECTVSVTIVPSGGGWSCYYEAGEYLLGCTACEQ